MESKIYSNIYTVKNYIKSDFLEVDRIKAKNESKNESKNEPKNESNIEIDVNKQYFPTNIGSSFELILYDSGSDIESIISDVDYVMYGIIYKIKGNEIYVSFGGLLMKITNNSKSFESLKRKSRIYCSLTLIS